MQTYSTIDDKALQSSIALEIGGFIVQ